MSAPKLLNTVYFIFLDIGPIFSMCILIFFPNYINIYFKKDKVKGYKGPQTLTCIDKKNISKAQHILLSMLKTFGLSQW